jgi:hypothetical protein
MGIGPRVKGVAFRTVDTVFAELRGNPDRERARAAMHPEVRHAYENGLILAASWYPIDWYKDVLGTFRSISGDSLEMIRSIGYRSAQHDMASVYKQLFARLVSPQLLLSFSGKLFNTYYDTGKFEVVESQKGHVKVRCSECLEWDHNMWTEITGSSVAMLEIAGAKQVRLRVIAGGRDGDTTMEMGAYWQ